MRTTRCSRLLLVLCALSVDAGAFAQVDREGTEFQINTYSLNYQGYAAAAADATGDFVVVWEQLDSTTFSIIGQRFASSGTALGSEFQVNTYTTGESRTPDVAMDADGDFVVVWRDSDFGNLLARRFSSAGTVLSGDFKVVQGEGSGTDPAIDADADGDFVVAWVDTTVDGDAGAVVSQRFSSNGTPLATELVVNLYTPYDQSHPDVSTDSDGDYVVVWDSTAGQDGNANGIFARLVSSSGTAQGVEIQINVHTTSNQQLPAVSMDANGDFVIAWESNGQDAGEYGIFGRRFSNSGAPLTGELQINSYTEAHQRFPSVAANDVGAFVVTWMGLYQDGSSWGVFGRRFSSSGTALASELQVNSYTDLSQRDPDVASSSGSSFVIAWQSYVQDGSSYGIFGQRFATPITLDIDGDGIVLPLTDLILGLRYAFGFRGDVLIDGAVGMSCTRCDAPSIEAYLTPLVN